MWTLGETYNLYKDNHAPRMDTQHPRNDKRTHIRTSRPVTAESVHAEHIDYGNNAQSVHDNNAYVRPAGPHQSLANPPPPPRVPYTADPTKPTPTNTLHSTNPRSRALLVCGIPVANTLPRSLIRVSDTRGRVLFSKCHGKNDDAFHFCQWCASPSTYDSRDSDTTLLYIDEYTIEQRFA